MEIQNKIYELNKYLKRSYIISYDKKTKILTIKNKIHVYELFMIRKYVARGYFKVKDIRIEG